MVRDDPKLLDDSGEIPKCQGRGWLFGSRCEISAVLDRNLPGGQLPPRLWRWNVGLLT